jgi:RNA polymerase sigma factor (sigma-70 family)
MPAPDSVHPPPADPKEARERRALANEICTQHRAYVEALLAERRDVFPASAPDLVQEVLLVLNAEVQETGREPEKVQGFLKRTVDKKVANHKRLWRPARAGELDADDTVATSTESDPEGTAELYEQLLKVERWSRGLSPAQVEVLRCTHAGMNLDEIAAALGRPRSTVHAQLQTATEELQARARDSERAAAERARAKRARAARAPRRAKR